MAIKKKGKFEFEVEYRIEAMISVTVWADSEDEAKEMIYKENIEPEFGVHVNINDSNTEYIGIRNMTKGWNKFNS